jgi:hypothetical protein
MFEYYVQLRRDSGLPMLPIGLFLRVGLDGIGWDAYAVQRFLLSLADDPHGSVVELNGRAVACVVPVPARNGEAQVEWTDAKNERRCGLIDKEIDGTLTPTEAIALFGLQQEMLHHRPRVGPVPIAAARQLHRGLLGKRPQPLPNA